MLRSEEHTLADDLRVRINMLPAGQGMPIYCRLVQLAGSALAHTKAEASDDSAIIGDLIKGLMSDVDLAAEVDKLIKAFGSSTVVIRVDNSQPTVTDCFEIVFAGRYDLVIKWLILCCKLNFGASFLGLVKNVGALKAG